MGRESLPWNVLLVLVGIGAMLAIVSMLAPSRVARRVPPATAEALGAMRLWIAAILIANVLWEDLPSSAYLPREMLTRDLQWVVALLLEVPGFAWVLSDAGALRVFEVATLALLCAAAAGAFTRWTVPAACVFYLVLGSILRSYDHIFHQGIVPLYALALLAFTPCGDALSVDRWRRRRRGLPVAPARTPELRYGLGRCLVWLAIALPYLVAVLSKLRNAGLWWWHGENMRRMVAGMVAEPTHFSFPGWRLMATAPEWVWHLMGLGSLLLEAVFVMVLVSSLARRVLPALMVMLHLGILFLQNIFFPDLVAIQAVFYNWRGIAGALSRRRASRTEPAAAVPGGGAAPAPAPSRGLSREERRLAMVAAVFTVVCFGTWATRTEKFPFTAWQMFSGWHEPGPVEHVRPIVVYEDGTRERARFERWIWAVADGRFRWLLTGWDRRPERIGQLRDFLDACAAIANREAPPGRRVARFEIEVWEWDYRRHPAGPQHAELRRVLRHPVAAPGA